jgi:radical SAM protein with 4Fe4S-binding SPASM domain
MCEFANLSERGTNLKFDQFQHFWRQVKGGQGLKIITRYFPGLMLFDMTGIGEPLLNPDFLKIVGFLKHQGVRVTFADNFTLMTEATIKELINSKVDLIFISFDGATKKTYERIREGASFDVVISNIKMFVDLKRRLNSAKPRLVVRFLVTSENVNEMEAMVDLASRLGIEYISFTKVNTKDSTKYLEVNKEEFKVNKTRAQAKARNKKIALDFGLFHKLPYKRCIRPYNSVYITVNGFVMPCCFINQGGEYERLVKDFNFGNVFKEDINKIWHSKKYRAFRKSFAKGKIPVFCKNCYLYK